jgi:hypothetical protein
MPERDDLKVDVPYFGSAHQDEVAEQTNAQAPQVVTVIKSGSHWVHTIMILGLIAAVGAIGYWGYDFKQDQEQRLLLAEATESRIAELEQLLADSQAQAKKSGQTLQQRLDAQFKLVEEQKKVMDTQYNQYEENFAKLIENASVKQAQQLDVFNKEIGKLELKIKNTQEDAQEEMGFMTSQQKTALSGLEDRLTEMDGLRTALTNLEINQTKADSVQTGIVADLAVISKDLAALTTKTDTQVAGLKTQTQAVDSNLEQYKATAHKSIKALTSKVSVIARKAAPKLSSSVTKRLKNTESAIAAIDGSRAQVNKEIQRLKSKVNKIQLQLQ